MIPLQTKEIAQLVQGQLVGADIQIQSVSTDSRNITQGDLFIALKGPNFDGHQFAADVISKGAVALIVEQQLDVAVPQIIVADTRLALGALGSRITAALTFSGSPEAVSAPLKPPRTKPAART